MTDSSRHPSPRRGLSAIDPHSAPTASALFAAIGGLRGIVESVSPGFAFLVVYTLTTDLLWSVVAPVTGSVIILIVRLIQRLPLLPAISGGIGIALSAGLALWTGRAADNFVGGFFINAGSLLAIAISLVVRKPLVGVIAGMIVPHTPWLSDPSVRRTTVIATNLWAVFFALRLVVQLPLYFANATAALAATKLIMGLPFYAAMLWVTWLMLRSATLEKR